MNKSHTITAWLCLCVASLLAFAPVAHAQTSTIETKYVVVTRTNDNPAPLRCFAGQIWYPVAYLEFERVLVADGIRDDWYRVAYPQGVPVAIGLDAARYNATTKTVTLTDPSPLRARNISQPTFVESYKEVLDRDLPPGTELPVIGEMHDDGVVAGVGEEA